LVETPARRTVDLVFEGVPDAEQIAAAVREVNVVRRLRPGAVAGG
jgi:hypothetical protein